MQFGGKAFSKTGLISKQPLSSCASCPKTSSTKPRRTKFSSVEDALQKRPQSLKNEPKEERQPKATQLSPAGDENREDGKREEGELAAEGGNGLCSLLAGHLQGMR